MKKIFTTIAAAVVTVCVFAQVPQKMSYQAVIRDAGSNLVKSLPVGMRIQILQTSEFGAAVYVETHSPTTNVNGLVTLEIGNGTVVLGTFAGINWANGPYFIKVETDIAGGTNYSITGVSQILSVPFALYAKTAATSDDAVKLTGNQTISGNKSFTGTTTVPTPINSTDAVTKVYVDALVERIEYLEGLKVKDQDGNVYSTVTIGNQMWMSENLKTTRYNDGTSIPLVPINTDWTNLTTSGYCWYNNDQATYGNTFGALYNWYAVNTNKLCPTGWHVSTDAEWTTLTTYLGGYTVAGGKLKETGTTHWNSPNEGATNESGFTALPGGYRYHIDGSFLVIGIYGIWWTQTNAREINKGSSGVVTSSGISYKCGYSVRCVKD